jgi:pilus assembly protein Flp/PilA
MLRLFVSVRNYLAQPLGRPQPGERGATAAEYALLVGLVAAVILTVVTTIGAKMSITFSKVVGGL